MPKKTAPVVEVSQKEIDEILFWAGKLGVKYSYNASKGGYQINGVVYRQPAFRLGEVS